MQTPGLNHDILTVSNTERSRAFHGDLLSFTGIVIEEDHDKNVFFPSHRPVPNDCFSKFRIGLDHPDFNAPSMIALRELADKRIAGRVDMISVEPFVHTRAWYVLFRDPDNFQLEFWLS